MKVLNYDKSFDDIHGDDFVSKRRFKEGPLKGYEMKTFEEDVWPPHFHLEDPNGNIVCAISMNAPEYIESHVKTIKFLTDEEKLQIIDKFKERSSQYFNSSSTVWRFMYCKALEYTGWYSNIKIDKYLEIPEMPDYMKLPNQYLS